jgi:hypothetical protein
MNRRAAVCLICLVTLFPASSARAQSPAGANPQPTVTADNEPWYRSGEPLTYEGNVYYAVGPLTAFNRNEMVRTGFYRGIPLYTRTTYEPWSVVFVPVSGGYMRPYLRRRSGEIAGTIGSIGPGVPIERDDTSRALTAAPLQAAGPPTNVADTPVERPLVTVTADAAPVAAPGTPEPRERAVGTAGGVVALPLPRPFVTIARPAGINGAYVEFGSERWVSDGPAVQIESTFRRIGAYHGLPVYISDDDRSTIYIPVTSGGTTLVTPYGKRR